MKALLTKQNLTILLKAFALSLFFTGTGQIFGLLFPKKSWANSLVMIGIAVAVLLIDDGSLSELYKLSPAQTAAMATKRRND
jgi:hypothetical protein